MAERPRIDTSVAHPARRYDYWLGGKDNFAADRASGDAIAARFPSIRTAVVENRRFLRRVVRHLAGRRRIRQFLDIGTGLPTAENTHQVAQAAAPESRIVYVDNDPLVLAHARALLTSTPQGATAYLDADLREPERILSSVEVQRTLDLSRPVGLILMATLHFLSDDEDPHGVVRRLLAALAPGSFLALSHATSDFFPPSIVADLSAAQHGPGRLRARAEIARFFDGCELVDPGLVPPSQWRAGREPRPRPAPEETAMYAGLGRLRGRP